MLTNPQSHLHPDDDGTFVDELKPGTKLLRGQYTIDRFLNAGGFGITYLARDSLDRKVVIKECFPGAFCRRSRFVVQARSRAHQSEFKSIVRLFVQEARSLAKLSHPSIVGVHQVFEDNETAYMALDFVEGRDLLQIIEDPQVTLPPEDVVQILRDVLGAVAFIHSQGMLHRDISPDNILITPEQRPILIDFGAAREQVSKQSRALSALRVVKDGYSPQEFYIAGSDQNPSSDLYALAASFHHQIAGTIPPNAQARLAAIASGDPDPYVGLVGRMHGYDNRFLAALDKALSVLPKDRVQSADDWLAMLDGHQPSPTSSMLRDDITVVPATNARSVPKPALMAGALAGIALVGWAALILTRPAPLQPETAPAAAIVPAPDTAPVLPTWPVTSVAALGNMTGARPVQDNATPVLSLPPEPAAIPGQIDAIDTIVFAAPPPRPQPSTAQFVQLPFEAAGMQSNIIARATGGAPDWVAPGLVVAEVNGIAVTAIADIGTILQDMLTIPDRPTLEVTFGLHDPATGDRLEQSAVLPVVQTLTLGSGHAFETRFGGDTWSTMVTAVPDNPAGDLQIGDILVSYIPTAKSLDARDSLAVLLGDEAMQDTENLIFAVQRDGMMWVASLANGAQD